MSLKHGLLGLIKNNPKTGYELDKEFKESLAHFWQATASQIYYDLDKMEQKGWLTSERVMQEEKPNKRVYTITAKGRAEFLNWLSSPGADIQHATRVKSVFFMRLFFAKETGREKVLALLYTYREQCLEDLKTMDTANEMMHKTESNYDPEDVLYWKLIMLHGDMMRKTRLAWAEKAITTLTEKN